MSTYFIGDIHGCYKNLRIMLDQICFDPNIDTLHFTGDLVARGLHSLEVLRFVYSLKKSASLVLGNHELHLLKIYFKINNQKHTKDFDAILNAPDLDELMYWLRNQPLLHTDETRKILMIHAGINPNWNIYTIKQSAREIEKILAGKQPNLLLQNICKNTPILNNNLDIKKLKQIQENINVFTRIRYVYSDGTLDLKYKGAPKYAPKNIYPWFSLTKLINPTPTYSIIFGHWATLKNTKIPNGVYGLDSGCCWGGTLTALRWEDKKIICIPCIPEN